MTDGFDFGGLIVDLDGVVWLGGEPVPGSVEALAQLRARRVPVVFLTNDPTNSRAEHAARLRQIGVETTDDEVVTSGTALATLILDREGAGKTAFVVGTLALKTELERADLQLASGGARTAVDVVAVAAHSRFNYEELRVASQEVSRGARLYAAGRDATFPMPDGAWPATGAILAAVETATGVRARVAGKPEPHIFELARSLLGACRNVAIIGDTLGSDIVGGKRAGLATILVLTGTSSRDDLRGAAVEPDLVLDDLAALVRRMPSAANRARSNLVSRTPPLGHPRGLGSVSQEPTDEGAHVVRDESAAEHLDPDVLVTMRRHRVAVIAGDGVGPEVIDAARQVIDVAADRFGFDITLTDIDLGARHYLETGELLSDDMLDQLRGFDAILFGAMGDPSVPPGVLERGVILRMRTAFRQAVNLRPIRLYPGVATPIAGLTPERCDLVVVRENTEGAYVGTGATVHAGTPNAVATQESVNTRHAIARAVEFAFRLANQRRKQLTLCHKKNVLVHAGALWQETVDEIAPSFPDVTVDYVHVDAMCFYLPTSPERFDVVVTDNLFGDIVTDLGAVLQGGLGVAASGNLNLDGSAPSMFEPVHGSAPDIAGRGWANPAGALLSAAMCLASLGERDAARAIEAAVASVLSELPALAGDAMGVSTAGMGARVADRLEPVHGSPYADERSIMDALAALAIRN